MLLSPQRLPRHAAAPGLWLMAAAGTALALSACGGSRATPARAGASARRAQQTSATSAATPNGVCRSVRRPQPKGPQHLSKPTMRLDPSRSYVARLHTNCGEIDIKLDVRAAPAVAASFVYLVNHGFYDDLTFHRVVSGYVIEGGDPNGDGSGGPGYTVTERPPANTSYTRGTVAMAKAEGDPPGTAGSQFFIVTGRNVDLPPRYAILGWVVGGESTVAAISHMPTTASSDGEDGAPSTPVVISAASIAGG